jgi:Lon protease-like protein
MLDDLRRGDNRFCVSRIVDGEEVGESAEPASVGCLAEIVQIEPMPGERFYILAVGVERVRLLSLDRISKPYLMGSLEMLADEGAATDDKTVGRARTLFTEYLDCMMKLSAQEESKMPIPEEADMLSYLVAAALQLEPQARQDLLEQPSSEQRLAAEIEIMQSELPILRSMVSANETPSAGYGQFSAN